MRIRTTKPEFWSSEQIMELSPIARLAFIGLWNFCDDNGVHPASVKTLKAEVFPSDDMQVDFVASLVEAMIQQGLVNQYRVAGKPYWIVTGWKKHQRIDKPTCRHPLPPPDKPASLFDDIADNDPRSIGDNSSPGSLLLDEDSTRTRPRSLKEGSRVDGNGTDADACSPKGSRLPTDWTLPGGYRQWAINDRGWSSDRCDDIALKFRDFWIAQPGQKGVKADWLATWRNWCRNEKTTPAAGVRHQKPENFLHRDYGRGGSL